MTTDYNLLTFKAISTFTNDLSEIFGTDYHSLKLYQRLLDKTTITHEKAISKHIDAFKHFCISNRDAILNKNLSKLNNDKIEYSSRVYIDIVSIMKKADTETVNVIWKHLLNISAFVDPAGKAKEILKKNSVDSSNESDFLENIINKVESNINPNSSNPLEAVSTLMSSGVFNDLVSGMNTKLQDGSLDLGKLVGTVEKMCSTLIPPQAGNNGEQASPLNLAGLMSSIGPILSNLSQTGASGVEGGGLNLDAMMKQLSQIQSSKTIIEEVKKEDE